MGWDKTLEREVFPGSAEPCSLMNILAAAVLCPLRRQISTSNSEPAEVKRKGNIPAAGLQSRAWKTWPLEVVEKQQQVLEAQEPNERRRAPNEREDGSRPGLAWVWACPPRCWSIYSKSRSACSEMIHNCWAGFF